jgi:glycosyltransferase involved in cell wall biosynthesis
MHDKPRLLRITTASISLKLLLRGQFTFFQQHGFEVLTVSADGPEVNDIIAEGVPHQVVNMTRMITPVQDLLCLWQLVRVIRKFNPDIIHTHTPKAGLLGMMAAWLCGVPVRLHTVAGLPLMEAKGIKRLVLKLTERITYQCATRVYPNSRGLFDYIMKEFNISNHKLEIIGKGSSNGIDSKHFLRTPALMNASRDLRRRYQIADDTIVFCFVGRIVRDKGITELVEAFQKLSSSAEVRLMLVGPFEQELDPLPEETMHYIKHDAHVISAGFQHDVRPWLLASDVFVFPSYREGFPNVVMQAACLEVPCIVSDINGCNEIIEDRVSGLIVPPKNAKALLDAMLMMATEKEMRTSFAVKARTFVIENFDQQFVWNELLKEYRALLGER